MVFHIVNYVYLHFWLVAWNVVILWHAIEVHSQRVPNRICQSTWATRFIGKMPLDVRWNEVTLTFRHLTLCREECAPYFYRGSVEFLLQVEHYVDHLGFTSRQRNAAAIQLAQTELI